MKWQKLGKIFDPRDTKIAKLDFTQAPSTLVFDDFVRIYFSTRIRDSAGEYISRVAYVDAYENLRRILHISTHIVIEPGELGCYDEHGIFPFNVLRHEDMVLGYIGGWSRRISVPVETSIGLAVSYDDGLTFQRVGNGPVLTSSPREPFLVGDPFVAFFDGQFHMWYIFGTEWKGLNRVYKIGYAESPDGVSWHKVSEGQQIIPSVLGEDECQAMPTVVRIGDRYCMFFCYREATDFRENRDRSYRIGYAYSDDLIYWTRDDGSVGINVSDDSWDSQMLCYPHVFHYRGEVYMLYNGNEFGRYGFGLARLEGV